MTVIQLGLLAIGVGWVVLGLLALYRRDVDYTGQQYIYVFTIRIFKKHRFRYEGYCAIMYGVILIVFGLIAMSLSLVIR